MKKVQALLSLIFLGLSLSGYANTPFKIWDIQNQNVGYVAIRLGADGFFRAYLTLKKNDALVETILPCKFQKAAVGEFTRVTTISCQSSDSNVEVTAYGMRGKGVAGVTVYRDKQCLAHVSDF